MTCVPTVKLAKRAMTNASPRSPDVIRPPASTAALPALLVMNVASDVTSRSVPSEYFASTVSCWRVPLPSRTSRVGATSMPVTCETLAGSSFGAPAWSHSTSV